MDWEDYSAVYIGWLTLIVRYIFSFPMYFKGYLLEEQLGFYMFVYILNLFIKTFWFELLYNVSNCEIFLHLILGVLFNKGFRFSCEIEKEKSKVCLLVSSHFCNVFQIVHWRNHLRFPEEARLTPAAKDLISQLLCDVDHRLGTLGAEQIKVNFLYTLKFSVCYCSWNIYYFQLHPWFKDVAWDTLYEMEAAYKPEVNGELDTQNFMKFDEVTC